MLPTPVFLPGKSHGQRSLAGYSFWGRKRVGQDCVTERRAVWFQQHRLNSLKFITSQPRCPAQRPRGDAKAPAVQTAHSAQPKVSATTLVYASFSSVQSLSRVRLFATP